MGTKKEFDSSLWHFFIYILYMSINEIEFEGMKKALSKLGRKTAALVKIQKEGNCANPGSPDYSHGCKLLNSAMSGGKRKKSRKTRRKKRRKTRIKRRKKRTKKKTRKRRKGGASQKRKNINHKKIVRNNSSQNNVPAPVLQTTNNERHIGAEVILTDAVAPFNVGIIRSIDFPHYTIEMQYPSDEGEIIVTADDIVITA